MFNRCGGLLTAMPVMAEELQPRAEILNTLVKVNDHYLKKHPDPLLGIPLLLA